MDPMIRSASRGVNRGAGPLFTGPVTCYFSPVKHAVPLALLLLLMSTTDGSALEIRIRASSRLAAELERRDGALHVTGTLQTDWGAPLSDAPLRLETPDGHRELTTDKRGRFAHPLRRHQSPFTLVLTHPGDSRHGPSETSLAVHPGRAVSQLSLLVDPNRWRPGDRAPVVLAELQAEGRPLAGEELEAIIGADPPVVLTTDSAGRARWSIAIDRLRSPGSHRIQALFEGNPEVAPAHAESQIASTSIPSVSIDRVETHDGNGDLVIVGHASLPGVDWLPTPYVVLVDGDNVHTGIANREGLIHMRLPRTSLSGDVFERSHAFQLRVPAFRSWVQEVTTPPFHQTLPGVPHPPLVWYVSLIAGVAAIVLLWRALLFARERGRDESETEDPQTRPGTLRGAAFDPRTGEGVRGATVTLEIMDGPSMSTPSGPDGEFTFLVGDAQGGTLAIVRKGHLPTRTELRWNPLTGPGALRVPLPGIRDEVLRLHGELLAAHGEGRHATTLSPRRLLRRVMRTTQRRHDLHRELVDLIEGAAFRRDGASLQSLERVQELVALLRPRSPRRAS